MKPPTTCPFTTSGSESTDGHSVCPGRMLGVDAMRGSTRTSGVTTGCRRFTASPTTP